MVSNTNSNVIKNYDEFVKFQVLVMNELDNKINAANK